MTNSAHKSFASLTGHRRLCSDGVGEGEATEGRRRGRGEKIIDVTWTEGESILGCDSIVKSHCEVAHENLTLTLLLLSTRTGATPFESNGFVEFATNTAAAEGRTHPK